jgi:hypothetical protein
MCTWEVLSDRNTKTWNELDKRKVSGYFFSLLAADKYNKLAKHAYIDVNKILKISIQWNRHF